MQSQSLAPRRWWYIIPIVFFTYSLAYLDRANYGFAAASGMAADLMITPGLSSLLGALFFLGYFFFQIPGAIYAQKNSVKKLIFVSLILWGGLATLTRSLAIDLAPEVRVNGVAPGPIDWPEDGQFPLEERQRIIAHTLLKRVGSPSDIARTVRFLMLDAPYITGQVVNVDGGRSAHLAT